MAELNQNQNSKQAAQPDVVRKLYFTLEINEQHNQQNFLHILQNCCSDGIRKFPRKLPNQVVVFDVQYIYFYDLMEASEKSI